MALPASPTRSRCCTADGRALVPRGGRGGDPLRRRRVFRRPEQLAGPPGIPAGGGHAGRTGVPDPLVPRRAGNRLGPARQPVRARLAGNPPRHRRGPGHHPRLRLAAARPPVLRQHGTDGSFPHRGPRARRRIVGPRSVAGHSQVVARAARAGTFAVTFRNGFRNPSLFQGAAGVGYQLLRVAGLPKSYRRSCCSPEPIRTQHTFRNHSPTPVQVRQALPPRPMNCRSPIADS